MMIALEKWTTFEGNIKKVVTKIMKVRVIKRFNDRENGFITRTVNEIFECSKQRAEQLTKLGFVEIVKDKSKTEKAE